MVQERDIVTMPPHGSFCTSGSLTASLLTFATNCTGCQFSKGLSTKCVFSCINAFIRQYQRTSPNCASQCLHPPAEATSARQHSATSQYLDPEHRHMVREVSVVSGPTLWNSLPLNVHDSSLTLTQFCTRLKTVLFSRAYATSSWRLRDSFRLRET